MSFTCEALSVNVETALKDACLIFHVLRLIPSTLSGPARLHLPLTSHGLPKQLIFLPVS